MDLAYSAEEEAFRQEVRAFLSDKLPPDIANKVKKAKRLNKDDFYRWHNILYQQGWVSPSWAEGVRRHRLDAGPAPDFR